MKGNLHLLGFYPRLALVVLLLSTQAVWAQEASENDAPLDESTSEPSSADDGLSDPGAGAIEFVDEGPSPFDNEDEMMELPEEQEDVDEVAPTIDDFAVAAGSPDALVRITAVVTDDASGIEKVEFLYKVGDDPDFQTVVLKPQQGGLFIGVLPDGPQRTGFVYYAQASDAAGNVATLGSAQQPYKVKPSRESDLERLERSRRIIENEPSISPIWIAATLGLGVISGAGAALFIADFARLWFVILPQELEGSARHSEIQQLALADAIIGGLFAAFAVTGFAGATGLIIYTALEE